MLRTASHSLAFEPCIPTQADRPPSGPGWVHEIKHDGFRLIAQRDEAGVRLITRNGHDWTERYPAVAAAGGRLRCRSCIIDGEVVVVDEVGRTIFERLQQGPKVNPEAIMFAFDLVEIDGQDLRREPLLTRKATLLSLLKSVPHGIVYNEHLEGDATMIFRHACRLGCEGIVSKRADSTYRSGRSRDWIKTKAPAAIEAQKIRGENWNSRR
jgi:bifunctional non-homologous end joining protein LigD